MDMRLREATETFKEMIKSGIQPDDFKVTNRLFSSFYAHVLIVIFFIQGSSCVRY